ncbi:MAG: hypothetical protein CO158_01750 [Piscirickettsiaceae bacterium CG_4_9_14_3_um_filter_43_564]|nr:tyrosine-type recombinase/integrase [Thiomicrospira sp.]OIP94558.1 MAG: hypothetical protein AUK56_08690 [Thiomicrospira sp. CG2_30_44_34]PIQ02808.1 MAG: integrase [Piscirickettsiaceae bacterium CG18_big_fil_WC_8_21_14_2_50_44_103]PIU37878.1 MAG: hypothetical protein COT01_09570 [Piscirickettsiaceae bacterium CG07_land_8_20_14_0_80_44_28]PIW57762.1 MAG: hypothetical protein COW14_04240 [Piscirickettsiaceae bacterium CG12_big_fil_rev_8_21_14_0_65_44_934]PIW78594.1 MAG: hypothetical protein C
MASFYKHRNSWRAQIRYKGVNKSKTGFKTKREEQAWAMNIENEIDESHSRDIPDRPFGDALRRYLEQVSVQHRGFEFEQRRIKRWIGESNDAADPLCFVPLDDLQPKHFADWRDRRLQQVSAGTVLREWVIFSAVCNSCAREWGWLKDNPMSKVKRPAEPDSRTRRPANNEINQLLLSTDYDIDDVPELKINRVGAAMVFSIETAMRAGEICAMTWDNVNLDKRTVFLPKTKNGSSRVVPLSTTAIKVLEGLKQVKDCRRLCFGLTGRRLDALFRKCRSRCTIDDLHFHDFRREACTRLAKKVDVMTLAKISGHRDLRILQKVYYESDMADVAMRLD